MKKIIIIIIIVIGQWSLVIGQTLAPTVSPTSGGYYNAGGNSLSWTMGETYNTTLSGGSNMLTQGEQQPYIVAGGCTSAPASPAITGPNSVCGLQSAIYTAGSSGATSYTWTIPNSTFIITSGQGTSSVHITFTAG